MLVLLLFRFVSIFHFTIKQWFLLMGVKNYFFVPGYRELLPQHYSPALGLIQLLILGPLLQKVAHLWSMYLAI